MLDHLFEILKLTLKMVLGLNEDGIQLKLKKYNSNFVTNEKIPGIYSIKDISAAL